MSTRVHAFIASLPAAWLRAHGGLPEGVSAEELTRADGVSTETQRRMLSEVALRAGERGLLGLGAALETITDQPLLFVMLNSRDVPDFIDKEQRFNRFFHSDHRLRVRASEAHSLELEHQGVSEAPARVESLFVLGLHLHLFALLGCTGVRARLPNSQQPQRAIFEDGKAAQTLPAGGHTLWRIEWQDFAARRQPMQGLDELLVRGSAPVDLEAGASLAARVRRVLQTDLMHRWTVTELARALGLSTRSLQRGLSAEQTAFSALLEEKRVEAACQMLREPGRSLTEVGYLCGFSDSAHFSRRFRARMGMTPSAYRADGAD